MPADERLETEAPLITEQIVDENDFPDEVDEGGRIDFEASPNMGSPKKESDKSDT